MPDQSNIQLSQEQKAILLPLWLQTYTALSEEIPADFFRNLRKLHSEICTIAPADKISQTEIYNTLFKEQNSITLTDEILTSISDYTLTFSEMAKDDKSNEAFDVMQATHFFLLEATRNFETPPVYQPPSLTKKATWQYVPPTNEELYRSAYQAYKENKPGEFLKRLYRLHDQIRRQLKAAGKLSVEDIEKIYYNLTQKIHAEDMIETIDSNFLCQLAYSAEQLRNALSTSKLPNDAEGKLRKEYEARACHLHKALSYFGGQHYDSWVKNNAATVRKFGQQIQENDNVNPIIWNHIFPKKIDLQPFQELWDKTYAALSKGEFTSYLTHLQALDNEIREAVGNLGEPLKTTAVNVVYTNLYQQQNNQEKIAEETFQSLVHLNRSLYRAEQSPYNILPPADEHSYKDSEISSLLEYYSQNLDSVDTISPMPFSGTPDETLVKDILASYLTERNQQIRDGKIVKNNIFYPITLVKNQITDSGHYVLLFIAYKNNASKKPKIHYFDPYGAPIGKELKSLINAPDLFPNVTIKDKQIQVQELYNIVDCGAWIIEAARTLADSNTLPKKTLDITTARQKHKQILSPEWLSQLTNASKHFISDELSSWKKANPELTQEEESKISKTRAEIHPDVSTYCKPTPIPTPKPSRKKFNKRKAFNIGFSSITSAAALTLTTFFLIETLPVSMPILLTGLGVLFVTYSLTMLLTNFVVLPLLSKAQTAKPTPSDKEPLLPGVSPALGKVSRPKETTQNSPTPTKYTRPPWLLRLLGHHSYTPLGNSNAKKAASQESDLTYAPK